MDNNFEIISADSLSFRDQRSLIFHLLYAADSFDYESSIESIADTFGKNYNIHISLSSDVFVEAKSIVEQRNDLDEKIQPLLDNWRFDRLGTATRLILRQSSWELLNTQNNAALIINEAIELAKSFAEKDAYKFINGILDQFVTRYQIKQVAEENTEV